MKNNPLMQKVNFYISASFIFVFGLFMTIKVLNVANAEDPITDAVTATEAVMIN